MTKPTGVFRCVGCTMQWGWLPENDASTLDIWHVQRVGVMDPTTYLVDQTRILYVFRGSAGESGLIRIPGFAPDVFQDDSLYARSADGLWKIRWKAWLKRQWFRHTHESIFVNMRRQPALIVDELERKWYRFMFSDGHDERTPISRALYSAMRAEYRGDSSSTVESALRQASQSSQHGADKTPASTPVSTERATSFDVTASSLVKVTRSREDSKSQPS